MPETVSVVSGGESIRAIFTELPEDDHSQVRSYVESIVKLCLEESLAPEHALKQLVDMLHDFQYTQPDGSFYVLDASMKDFVLDVILSLSEETGVKLASVTSN